MERCFISPRTGFIPLWSFLMVTVIFCTATGDTDEKKWEELGEMQMPVTVQATTTQLWAVDWGPTQPLEEETHHFLSSLETDSLRKTTTSEDWSHHRSVSANQTQHPITGDEKKMETEEQDKEVDPQFYVTVTISSLLILSVVIISAKLCYDRSLSQRPPPLSHHPMFHSSGGQQADTAQHFILPRQREDTGGQSLKS